MFHPPASFPVVAFSEASQGSASLLELISFSTVKAYRRPQNSFLRVFEATPVGKLIYTGCLSFSM